MVGELVSTQAKPSFGSACFSTVPSIARTDKGFRRNLISLVQGSPGAGCSSLALFSSAGENL
jgi:hypothetical protein